MVELYERAIALCREAGFGDILLRGDTDFSLTSELDRWDNDRVRFVFGYDARANLVQKAEGMAEQTYHELVPRAERAVATRPRRRPKNVKDEVVRQRRFKVLRQKVEDVVAFSYPSRQVHPRLPGGRPAQEHLGRTRRQRLVRGTQVLLLHHQRLGDDHDEVVAEARSRCNQENLIAQLKGGVRALHAPLNVLVANSAYMVMAALAWSLKAWCTLLLPVSPAGPPSTTSSAGACSRWTSAPSSGFPCNPLPGRKRRPPGPLARPGLEPLARRLLPPPRRPLASKPSSTNEPLWPHLAPACPKTGSSAPKTTKDRSLASAPALQHRQLLPNKRSAPRAPPIAADDHRQLENACFRTNSTPRPERRLQGDFLP